MTGMDDAVTAVNGLTPEDLEQINQITAVKFNGLPVKISDHTRYASAAGIALQIAEFAGKQGFVYFWQKTGRGFEMIKQAVDTTV